MGSDVRSGLDSELRQRIRDHLERIYPQRVAEATEAVASVCRVVRDQGPSELWSERDIVLITYADQIRDSVGTPLEAFERWCGDTELDKAFSTVHLLPFFPYSSDDGFSVIDYRQVDPKIGTWDDVARLADRFDLMFDLVLNHVSQKSRWFQDYLAGVEPFTRWFIEASPDDDLSQVVRPRSLPLLTRFDTSRGPRFVWTTFSRDQIDLNYKEPSVLAEMIDVLLTYAERGARIIRLDAIAFLWKEIGTSSLHLPQTHEVVKLARTILDRCAPGTLVLTETNVPHEENISYFGHGDEAHIVYQFPLPPLLLDAFLRQDATVLRRWLTELPPPEPGTTFLNFTASHDGIGVRPLEGLVPPERIDELVLEVRRRGGLVSTRRTPDGRDAPYELNITYLDALRDDRADNVEEQLRPFLASQAVMLGLQGIPAVYVQSLVGGENDVAGVESSGQPRRINRHKYDREELDRMIADAGGVSHHVFATYCRWLATRRTLSAFHPDSPQRVISADDAALLAGLRGSGSSGDEQILVLANFSARAVSVGDAVAEAGGRWSWDYLSQQAWDESASVLPPYQVVWLGRRRADGHHDS